MQVIEDVMMLTHITMEDVEITVKDIIHIILSITEILYILIAMTLIIIV